MNKVLIVSPRFPPTNAADLHRVRTSLPYYRRFGWDPTVLCVGASSSDGVNDAALEASLPKDIDVVSIEAWSEKSCRRFGFGHLSLRCLVPLYYAGCKLLKQNRYDVVFFSTTAFMTFLLGPVWKRRFGCKIIYDFQDPWFQGKKGNYTRATAPGRWWKFRTVQLVAFYMERFALKSADHIICVSPGYVNTLVSRYSWLNESKLTVIPFGAEKQDYTFMRQRNIKHKSFESDKELIRWVSVGRAGPDMDLILKIFFEQLAALRRDDPLFTDRLRVYFVGTNYSPTQQTFKVVEPLASHYGVNDIVKEWSKRIPYHQALSVYYESDAVLLIGSKSADYTASKVFNCVLSRKPVLALFHEKSFISNMVTAFSTVHLVRFDNDPAVPAFRAAVAKGLRWLRDVKIDSSRIDRELEPWTANELTRTQCLIFDSVRAG